MSVAEKGGSKICQVRSGETSASEPLMTCRHSPEDVETGAKVVAPGTSLGGALKPGFSGIRLRGGVKPDQALLGNAGTCRSVAPILREKLKWEIPAKGKSTDVEHRDANSRIPGAG